MTTNYPEKGKNPSKRLQPFCLEQSTKKGRLPNAIKGSLIVLTVITILVIPVIPVEDDTGVIIIPQQKTPEIVWFADFEDPNDLDEWDQTS